MKLDVLRAIEACYACERQDARWLRGLLEALAPLDQGVGMFAQILRVGRDGRRLVEVSLEAPTSRPGLPDRIGARLFASPAAGARGATAPVQLALRGARTLGPAARRELERLFAGEGDTLGILGGEPGGCVAVVAVPIRSGGRVPAPQTLHQLKLFAAHLGASMRLRRAVEAFAPEAVVASAAGAAGAEPDPAPADRGSLADAVLPGAGGGAVALSRTDRRSPRARGAARRSESFQSAPDRARARILALRNGIAPERGRPACPLHLRAGRGYLRLRGRSLDRAGGARMAGTQLRDAERSWTTAPPEPAGARRLRSGLRSLASACLLPLVQRGGRAWVGGASLDDGLAVALRLAGERRPSTIGLWQTPEYSAREVAGEYLAGIDALATGRLDAYLSIKPPALRFDRALAAELASAARSRGVCLHTDSHGPEAADASCALIDAMGSTLPGRQLGATLPGRWARSVSDAGWAVDRGLAVRVVKGQWPDPADPRRDARAGLLEIVDRLAGRARLVRVASHDVPLAAEALRRLRRAGTPCELELLYGMPLTRSLRWADASGVPVRIYVPYGRGYLPYAVAQLGRNPRLLWALLREVVPARGPAAGTT